ncbi:MAG: restriction endonuclease subunit S [Microbacterium sp.]|uniref:restriction endonuclease subunit S n=1 Tax=Microbacterium sp. TaxID=51671 RepID=UPI003F950AE3
MTERATDTDFKVGLEGIEGGTGRLLPAAATDFDGEGVEFRTGDLLFGKLRPYLAKTWLADRHGAAVGDFLVLRPKPNADAKYLNYVLLSGAFLMPVTAASTGAKMPRTDWTTVKNLAVHVPPLGEQRAIADYLDQETAQIDALVAKQEEFVGLLRERRLSQITDAFARLGSPDTQLRRVADIQTGITLAGEGDPSHPRWPYLRVANVQMGNVDLSHVKEIHLSTIEAAGSMLRAGDVLVTEGGDIDKLGRGTVWGGSISPMIHQNHVFAVRAKPDHLIPAYLAWWLDSLVAREYFYLTAKKTTNLASTNKTVVGRLPMCVPGVDEQSATVERIRERVSRIDALIAKAEEHIALAKKRRSALITAAVTGQLDVRTARKAG